MLTYDDIMKDDFVNPYEVKMQREKMESLGNNVQGKNDILNTVYDKVVKKDPEYKPSPQPIRPTKLPKTNSGNAIIDTIGNALDYINKSKIASFGAGVNPLAWNKSIGNALYGEDVMTGIQESKDENPITAKAGEFAASLLPMAKASQIASKIPYLSNLGNLGRIGKVAQSALTEGIAGAGYGTVEGLYKGEGIEGAKNNAITYGLGGLGLGGLSSLGKYAMPTIGTVVGAGYGGYNEAQKIKNEGGNLEDNIGRLSGATVIGGTAGLLAGKSLNLAGKGIGNLYNNTAGFKNAVKNVSNSIDEYSFPQIRKTSVGSEMPKQYQQNTPQSSYNPKQLLLNAPKEEAIPQTILPKEEVMPQSPTRPIVLGKAPQGKFTIKPQVESKDIPYYNKLTPDELNKLESDINSEISNIELNDYGNVKHNYYYNTLKEELNKINDFKQNPQGKFTIKNKISIDNMINDINSRNYKDVGKRKVKAIQYNYPELKPYIQEQANILLGDLKNGIKGNRYPSFDDEGYMTKYNGEKRSTSEPIERILDNLPYKSTYKEIEEGLKKIIEDHGKENNALSKRIELVIDESLSNGYKDMMGYDIPPNDLYLSQKTTKTKSLSDFTPQRKTVELIRQYKQKMNSIESPTMPQNVEGGINSPLNINKPIETPINVKETNTIKDIRTFNDLPKDEEGLNKFIKDADTLIQSGEHKLLPIDLQLFADEAKKRLSNVYSNMLKKTSMFKQAEKEIQNPNDFMYDVKSEAESIAEAEQRLLNNYEGEKESLSKKESFTGSDVDTLMGIVEHERNLARDTGIWDKVTNVLKNVRKAGTELGRGVQAFLKYSRTTEGKLIEAQRVTDKATDSILEQSPVIEKAYKGDSKNSQKLFDDYKKESEKVIDEVVQSFEKSSESKFNKEHTDFPTMLSNKIINALKPKQQERSFIKDLINDLFNQSKETIEYPKKLAKPNSDIAKLAESYNFRNYKGEIRTKAQEMLKEKFKDNPNVLKMIKEEFKDSPNILKMLEEYFNTGFKPPHSEKLLNDVLNKRLSGLSSATNTRIASSNKPNLKEWVKDWYGSGGKARVDFVKGIIEETGLTGEEAKSLKNLLDSKLHNATKAIKDSLLELAMKEKSKGIVKNATTKIKEFINIGGLENQKFTNRIFEKVSPMLKQLLKENNINLNEIVKSSLLGQTRNRLLGNLTDSLKGKISDIELENLMHIIKIEFNSLADSEKNKILKGVFDNKNQSVNKFASEKLAELTHAGMFESTKFANVISEKLDPTIRKLIRENGININELVRLSINKNDSAKKELISNFFDTTTIRGSERDKIIDFIEKEFDKVSKNTRDKILSYMANPRKSPTQRTFIEKLEEMFNLGLYGDDVDMALQDAIKQKYNLPTLSNDEVKFIVETMDSIKGLPERSEAYLEGIAKVNKLIEEKHGVSLSEKSSSLAYTNILGNLKSGLMNVGGNALEFGSFVGTNPLKRVIDKVISPMGEVKGQRSVSKIEWNTMYNSAKQAIRANKRDMLGGNDFKDLKNMTPMQIYNTLANPINTDISHLKYGDKFEGGHTLAFKNRPMRIYENLVGTLMKSGDRPFFEAYMNQTLDGIIKANKNLNIPMKQIEEVAHQAASEMTYKDINIISKALTELKNLPKSVQLKMGINPKTLTGMDALIKESIPAVWEAGIRFAKTPANILKRVGEYTPFGIVEGAGKLLLNKNKLTLPKQREIVDRFARGIAGTALGGVGYGLSSSGNITQKQEKNKRASELNVEAGKQTSSLKIGNTNIDLTKGLPFTAPIIIGARLQKGDSEGVIDTTADTLSTSMDFMSEMGLLQNIKKLVGTTYSGKDGNPDTIGEKILSALTDLPKQYIPSLVKQAANYNDKYERDLKGGNFLQRNLINQIGGNIPFLSEKYPEKIDYKGDKVQRMQGNNGFINSFINPIKTTTEVTDDKVLLESLRLYGASKSKDTSLLLPKVNNKIGDISLTDENVVTYQKIMGDKVQTKINQLLNNRGYNELNDNDKAVAFSHALDLSRNEAKIQMLKELDINTNDIKRKSKQDALNRNKIYNQTNLFKRK